MRDADIRAAVLIFRTANALTLGGIANCANFPRALDAERSGIGSMPAGNGRGAWGVGRGAWGVGRGAWGVEFDSRSTLPAPRSTIPRGPGPRAGGRSDRAPEGVSPEDGGGNPPGVTVREAFPWMEDQARASTMGQLAGLTLQPWRGRGSGRQSLGRVPLPWRCWRSAPHQPSSYAPGRLAPESP